MGSNPTISTDMKRGAVGSSFHIGGDGVPSGAVAQRLGSHSPPGDRRTLDRKFA